MSRRRPIKDLTGQKFGLLTVAHTEGKTKSGNICWLCNCDCGGQKIVPSGRLIEGSTRSCGCLVRGSNHPRFNGGKTRQNQGYIVLHSCEHPNAGKDGRILEHRLVMSQHLGRPLTEDENVHHINGVRDDNRTENLELWNTSQPSGQRIQDKVEYAIKILEQYAPERLK